MNIAVPSHWTAAGAAVIAEIETALAAEAAYGGALQAKITELTTLAQRLEADYAALCARSVDDGAAASQAAALRIRIDAVRALCQKKSAELNASTLVTLAAAGPLLDEICEHYREALPIAIMAAIAPFCSSSQRPREIIQFTEAPLALRVIQDRVPGAMAATQANIIWVSKIFKNAAAGEPFLSKNRD